MPKISVIIPLYNKAAYIKRAVDSVLSQSEQDFEIVVVDDGSTDSGAAIVKSFRDPRVKYYFQNNSGVSVARNTGAEKSESDLLAFLDADDAWESDFISVILKLKQKYPLAGLYCSAYKVHDSPSSLIYPKLLGIPGGAWEGIIPNYLYSATGPSPASASSCAAKREVLSAVGGFPSGIGAGEDLATWLAIALRYPVAFSTYVGATYYRDAQNRVCEKRLVSEGYLNILRKNLSSLHLSEENRASLKIILEKELISLSSSCILTGDTASARKYLVEVTGNTFWRTKLYWYFLSCLPKKIRFILLKVKLGILNPIVSKVVS